MKKMWLMLTLTLSVVLGTTYAAEKDFERSETVLVDTFDSNVTFPGTQDALDWQVVASRNVREGFPKTVRANAWPRARFGQNPENADSLQVLGISASYIKEGDNWLEVIPTKAGTPTPLPLTGKVNAVSVWVWGNNYKYNLDAVFKDDNGIKYRVKAGSLNYLGWRNMVITLPSSVSQSKRRFPAPAKISLEKFIISSDLTEVVDDFYVYIDQITTTSVVEIKKYDGEDLAEITKASAVWGEEVTPYDYDLSKKDRGASANAEQTQDPNAAPAQNANAAPTENAEQPAGDESKDSEQKLVEISVSKMEDTVYWRTSFPMEYGKSFLKTFKNSPEDKVALANDKETDERVLATKVNFVKRGSVMLDILAYRPIRIDGYAKVVSLWVAGDASGHDLFLLANDVNGRSFQIPMGKLDFVGWKQMSIPIPTFIKQKNGIKADDIGMYVAGFRVRFDASAVVSKYQLYLDDVRALVDVYSAPVVRNANDPYDSW